MDSTLLSWEKHYDLLIKWKKRLKNELPLLQEIVKNFDQRNLKILEVAIGAGHPSLELIKQGFNFTGINLDSSIIEEAKKGNPKGIFIAKD